jgi:uncharacterized ParB-like nuclease family protein
VSGYIYSFGVFHRNSRGTKRAKKQKAEKRCRFALLAFCFPLVCRRETPDLKIRPDIDAYNAFGACVRLPLKDEAAARRCRRRAKTQEKELRPRMNANGHKSALTRRLIRDDLDWSYSRPFAFIRGLKPEHTSRIR